MLRDHGQSTQHHDHGTCRDDELTQMASKVVQLFGKLFIKTQIAETAGPFHPHRLWILSVFEIIVYLTFSLVDEVLLRRFVAQSRAGVRNRTCPHEENSPPQELSMFPPSVTPHRDYHPHPIVCHGWVG